MSCVSAGTGHHLSTNMAPVKYVTLVSCDGFEFTLPREACYVSPVLKRSVDPQGGFLEATTGRVVLESLG